MKYEMIAGLEVHVELKTESKLFCGCKNVFGAEPNSMTCPVCRGLPGTLPRLDREAVYLALKAGAALGCRINKVSGFARKNYFYPDLPKGYQITQSDLPLLSCGGVMTDHGRVRIQRIHIEEDAGKLKYDVDGSFSADFNRCGVPLIEIVSEPDIRSAAQAVQYLKALRLILLYAGVSDCKMQEGSMRCDVNISVREEGSGIYNERTEIKNVSSFRFVEKAMNYEFERQIKLLEAGEKVERMTLRVNESTGETEPMRKKESADDYRYFPEPDLPFLVLTDEEINNALSSIGKSPDEIKREYTLKYNIPEKIALNIIEQPEYKSFFEKCLDFCEYPARLASVVTSELFARFPSPEGLDPGYVGGIINCCEEGKISGKTLKQLLDLAGSESGSPEDIINRLDLWQINDRDTLMSFAKEAIKRNPQAVGDYKKGKKASAARLTGEALKLSGGKGDPKITGEIVAELLDGSCSL